MIVSTTITLFDNLLKGVGRQPKSGKKKGSMKVHTVMKYHVGVPMVVQLTSAAKHDHYLLKEVHLPKDSTLAMDRGYITQFQRLTEEDAKSTTGTNSFRLSEAYFGRKNTRSPILQSSGKRFIFFLTLQDSNNKIWEQNYWHSASAHCRSSLPCSWTSRP